MSALVLKLIALVCMTLDHIGYFVTKLSFLRIIGRLAFPIYVFLLTEGFRHTSNRGRYALRLAIFALISQLPFSLLFQKGFLQADNLLLTFLQEFYLHGNMMLSLLVSLLCLWLLEACKDKLWTRILSWLAVFGVFLVYSFQWIHTDYDARCLLLTLVFYYWKDHPILMGVGSLLAIYNKTLLDYGRQLLQQAAGVPQTYELPNTWTMKQFFGLFALPLIFLYNGERGWSPESRAGRKVMQLAFYAYYPLHMLILFFIFRL